MANLTTIKRFIKDQYQVLVFSFLIACNSIPGYQLTFVPGIDGPLPWVYNYFADGHFDKCVDLAFPHGPLAFFLYPLLVGNNVFFTVSITWLCSFLLSLNLFLLVKRPEERLTSGIAIFFLQTFLSIQLVIALLVLTYVLRYHQERKIWYYIPAVILTVFNLFIKTYGGTICFLILFSDWIINFFRRDYKHWWVIPVSGIVCYFLFRLCLFGTLAHSIDFLRAQIELSGGNSDSVSFYHANDWRFISFFIFTVILFPFLVSDIRSRHVWLIMILPFFAAWKHGLSRGDASHVDGFLVFIVLFYLTVFIISSGQKLRILMVGAFSCGAFMINMGNYATYNDFDEEKKISALRPYNLYKLVFRYDSLKKARQLINDHENRKAVLPDTLRKLIGKRTIDIWPWNYSIVAVNRLNWMPRPTLHPYAMYSAWLDEHNAEHLASEKASELILWEIKELGGGYRSADGRYLLNDGPRVTEELLSRYSLVYKDSLYFLYQKKARPEAIIIDPIGKKTNYRFLDLIDIPKVDSNIILRAKIELKETTKAKFKSFFYKGEGYQIYIQLDDREAVAYKIVQGNSRVGVWLSPLITDPGVLSATPRSMRFKLFTTDESMIEKEVVVQFETIRFKNNYDFKKEFFGKR